MIQHFFSGYSGKPKLSQVMFQVFSRWMLFVPIKLCSTEWCFILQTTFFTTFQGERKLHPCTQVCLHEAPNNTCSRFLKTSPSWYFLYLFGIDLLLSVFSCLFSFVTARGFTIHKPSGTKISAILVLSLLFAYIILGMFYPQNFLCPDLAAVLLFPFCIICWLSKWWTQWLICYS